MNERITQLAVEAGLLNYVDLETPRHYFIHGHADLEEVEKFAESLIRECIQQVVFNGMNRPDYYVRLEAAKDIENHFGIEHPDDETEQQWWQAIK